MSSKKTSCSAQDPSKCRYHGTEIRMNAAMQNQDFDAYFKERTKLESMKPENSSEVTKSENNQEQINYHIYKDCTGKNFIISKKPLQPNICDDCGDYDIEIFGTLEQNEKPTVEDIQEYAKSHKKDMRLKTLSYLTES